jgi:hypothetical protein
MRILAAATLGLLLEGCSDAYYERRQFISLATGDAVESNKVVHMVDPWPRHAQNRNIAYNGDRMQAAVERYRTGRIIQPVQAGTSSVSYGQAAQPAANPQASPQASGGGGTASSSASGAGWATK